MAVNGNAGVGALARAAWSAAMSGVLLSSACGGKATSDQEKPEVVCHYGGAIFRPGESFPDEHGCNTCSCGSNGMVTCTGRACACVFNGATYAVGQSFPAPDGCNTCSCRVDGISCTEIGCSSSCSYGGQQYASGESFPAEDGCNVCTCSPGGLVSCTNRACPQDCFYLGVPRVAGETFPSRDGCNSCSCSSDGGVACTEIACPCKPEAEWWRRYVGTSPGQCALIDFACPSLTKMFGNDCGCGCEQGEHCPRYQSCETPENCLQCPYSGIVMK